MDYLSHEVIALKDHVNDFIELSPPGHDNLKKDGLHECLWKLNYYLEKCSNKLPGSCFGIMLCICAVTIYKQKQNIQCNFHYYSLALHLFCYAAEIDFNKEKTALSQMGGQVLTQETFFDIAKFLNDTYPAFLEDLLGPSYLIVLTKKLNDRNKLCLHPVELYCLDYLNNLSTTLVFIWQSVFRFLSIYYRFHVIRR